MAAQLDVSTTRPTPAPLGGSQRPKRPLHRRPDQLLGVLRFAFRERAGRVHQDVDAGHGVVPPLVLEQVQTDVVDVGVGEQVAELRASAVRAHARLDRVVVLQQFADDVLGDEAGGSGYENSGHDDSRRLGGWVVAVVIGRIEFQARSNAWEHCSSVRSLRAATSSCAMRLSPR